MHNRQYSLLLTFSIFLENRFFQHNTASNAKDEIVKTHDAIRFSIDDVVELKINAYHLFHDFSQRFDT